MSPPLLTVQDLTVTYPRRGQAARVATRSVTFQIGRGEIFGFVGGAGAGKTTAWQMLGGMMPARARFLGGYVILDPGTENEMDLLRLSARKWRQLKRQRLAIFHGVPSLQWNPRRTVRQHIREILKLGRKERRKLPETDWMPFLYEVGLIDPEYLLGRLPGQLSELILLRLLFAMALMKGADLWLADDMTAGLDAIAEDQMVSLLRDLCQKHGFSLVVGTHDFGFTSRLADRAAVLFEGGIVESGAASALFDQPKNRYTRAMIDGMPQLGERRDRLDEVDQAAKRDAIDATRGVGERGDE